MDDKEQSITINIYQQYHWEDTRILINQSHPYWRENTSSKTRLNGDFVVECIWTPNLHFFGTSKMSMWKPSPTSLTDGAMEVYLDAKGVLYTYSYNMKLTVNCIMTFDKYPFDTQVK